MDGPSRRTAVNFADIHSHFLPGLDDGAPSYGVVMQMLQIAHQRGTRLLAATPHMFLPPYNNNDVATVHQAFTDTAKELWRRSHLPEFAFLQDLSLHLGSENYLSPEFLEALEQRRVLTLHGSRYLLLEFPTYLSFEMLVNALDRIALAGLVPVLAHVERYTPFLERPSRLAELVRRGCVAQLNGSSLLPPAGRPRRKIAHTFLRQGLVQVIASDAHDGRVRTPDLGTVFRVLRDKFPEHWILAWMYDNPRRILNNEAINNEVLG